MNPVLISLDGNNTYPITRAVTVIGRRDYCDIQIDVPGISRRHCLLVQADGLLVVRDLVSTNGTKVNGTRISWAALLSGDRLTLAGCHLKVQIPDRTSTHPHTQISSPTEVPAGSGTPSQPDGSGSDLLEETRNDVNLSGESSACPHSGVHLTQEEFQLDNLDLDLPDPEPIQRFELEIDVEDLDERDLL